jgi:general secretion pathway protein A
MYTAYYGLTRKPFDLIPDPEMVFMSESHQEALAILRYGVIDRKGFLLLTGDVGTGKTTLLNLLVHTLGNGVHCCLLSNPSLKIDDFYFTLATSYSLPSFQGSKARFLLDFAHFLETCAQKQERVLLIIDEAHALPVELLEEIRLLSNQKPSSAGIFSIFLVGQPELNKRLAHERLLPLRQRIGIRYHLAAFDYEETANYIGFRLRQAGAQRFDFFTAEALAAIHGASRGVPRLINIIGDQAMLTGLAESRPIIDGKMVNDSIRALHIPGNPGMLPLTRKKFSLTGLMAWCR